MKSIITTRTTACQLPTYHCFIFTWFPVSKSFQGKKSTEKVEGEIRRKEEKLWAQNSFFWWEIKYVACVRSESFTFLIARLFITGTHVPPTETLHTVQQCRWYYCGLSALNKFHINPNQSLNMIILSEYMWEHNHLKYCPRNKTKQSRLTLVLGILNVFRFVLFGIFVSWHSCENWKCISGRW